MTSDQLQKLSRILAWAAIALALLSIALVVLR